MAGAVQNCPNQPEDPCVKLAKKIDEMTNRDKKTERGGGTKGLKFRFQEQNAGPNGPPGSGVGDPQVWLNHDKAIKEQQKGLADKIDEFNDKNCGDKIPLPANAEEYATRPAPKASDWTGPKSVPFTPLPSPSPSFMHTMSKLTGLTGVGLLIYVIVSEGSRAFPPRNLVPVP